MENIKKDKWYAILIGIMVVFGVLLRLKLLLANIPLFFDEIAVALNLITKQYPALFFHLDYFQAAPPFFLIATKFLVSLFGKKEIVFRFIPFCCGCLSIFAFYFLAKQILNKKISVIIALFLFVINPALIDYSCQLKPYIADVLFTIIALLFFMNFDIGKVNKKQLILYACFFAICPWISFASVFVISGYLIYLFIKNFRYNLLNKFYFASLIFLGWAIYLKTYVTDNYILRPRFLQIWKDHLATLSFKHDLHLFKEVFNFFFNSPTNAIPILVLFIIGILILFREKRNFFYINLLMFIVLLVVLGLHLYPLYDRFVLFLLPTTIICMTKPMDLISYTHKIRAGIIFVLMLFFLYSQGIFLKDFIHSNSMFIKEDPRSIYYFMYNHIKKNDIIFITDGSRVEFGYYMSISALPNKIIYAQDYGKDIVPILKKIKKGYYWFYMPNDFFFNRDIIINWAKQHKILKFYQIKQSVLMFVKV